MVLLVGCGFQSQDRQAPVDASSTDVTSTDAPVDTPPTSSEVCWRLVSAAPVVMSLAICLPDLVERVEIATDVTINTTTGTSTASALGCALLSDGPDDICVLSASTITIRAGATLTAHGDRPLALLAHNVDVQGTIDVASHVATPNVSGSGATPDGCNQARGATGTGGGGGGGFEHAGGFGGNQGSMANTGAAGGGTISVRSLRGGCEGSGGGKAETAAGRGGAGGGAVWISADTGQITLGNQSVINASGAGGAAGIGMDHGGAGGGSGGLIVLQAPTIRRPSTTSTVFAKGGGGGGGAAGASPGVAGGDPVRGAEGGSGGSGGGLEVSGGNGDPSSGQNGHNGRATGGGGGGGGSVGIIWIASTTALDLTNMSPDPVVLDPP